MDNCPDSSCPDTVGTRKRWLGFNRGRRDLAWAANHTSNQDGLLLNKHLLCAKHLPKLLTHSTSVTYEMGGRAAIAPLRKKFRGPLHLSVAGTQAFSLRKEAVPFWVTSKVPSELKIL